MKVAGIGRVAERVQRSMAVFLGPVSEPSGKTSPGLPLPVLKRAGHAHHPNRPALLPSHMVTMEDASA